jgi:hypothetical protein
MLAFSEKMADRSSPSIHSMPTLLNSFATSPDFWAKSNSEMELKFLSFGSQSNSNTQQCVSDAPGTNIIQVIGVSVQQGIL